VEGVTSRGELSLFFWHLAARVGYRSIYSGNVTKGGRFPTHDINFWADWNGESRGALKRRSPSDVPAAFGPTLRTKEDRLVRTHQPSEADFGAILPNGWRLEERFPTEAIPAALRCRSTGSLTPASTNFGPRSWRAEQLKEFRLKWLEGPVLAESAP
jgi:hypothetical protein